MQRAKRRAVTFPCECGCGKAFHPNEMLIRPTNSKLYPHEMLYVPHYIEVYGTKKLLVRVLR